MLNMQERIIVTLDMATYLNIQAIFFALCFSVILILWYQTHNRFRGLSFWLGYFALNSIGTILIALRESFPIWVSISLAHIVLAGAAVLLVLGTLRFIGKRISIAYSVILLAILFISVFINIYYTFMEVNLIARILNYSGVIALYSLLNFVMFQWGMSADIKAHSRGTRIASLLMVIFLVARILGIQSVSTNEFLTSGLYDTTMLLFFGLSVVFLAFNLILMVNRLSLLDAQKTKGALKESEEKYKTLLKTAGLSIAYWDLEGYLQLINDLGAKQFGKPAKDLIGKSIQELLGKDAGDVYLQRMQEVATLGINQEYEDEAQLPTGRSWFSSTYSAVKDNEGKIIGIQAIANDITDRKKAEADRERILNLSADLICIASTDGYFKYLNPAWKKTLGYSLDELLARPFLDFIHPDDHVVNDAEVDSLASGSVTDNFENRYLHKDGSIRTILWTATPLQEEGLMFCIGHDITDRKRADESLQKSEQLHRSILASISDGFFTLDNNMVVTSFNSAAEILLGKKQEDVLGKNLFESFPEAKGSVFDENYSLAIREKKHIVFEIYFDVPPYKNWYDVRVYPYEDGISVYFQITTERKATEKQIKGYSENLEQMVAERTEELEESREWYHILLDSASDAVYVHNRSDDGEMLDMIEVNPVACKMLGYTREELLKLSLMDMNIVDRSISEIDYMALREQLMQKKTAVFESVHIAKDGRRIPVEISANLFRHKGKNISVALARDITERKRTEKELEDIRARAVVADRLAMVGQLASGVAHEVRNPLAVISNIAYLLELKLGGADKDMQKKH
jgi:PAS domain S-box-containing protein